MERHGNGGEGDQQIDYLLVAPEIAQLNNHLIVAHFYRLCNLTFSQCETHVLFGRRNDSNCATCRQMNH